MKPRILALASLLLISLATSSRADENLASFEHLEGAAESKSLVKLAPALLAYFNNGPVFGIPGTQLGSIEDRTQLTGDWDGRRTELAKRGIFLDVYTTSTYQDITSGGLKTGGSFVQNIQTSLNVDTASAGLWPGGLIHVTVQSRYGDNPANTFTAGTVVPQYTGLVEPGPLLYNDTYPNEFFLVQALSKKTSVVLGKISDVFIPDQTLMGDSYKYYFANFNFNKNPMTVNFYNPSALAALGVWTPVKGLAFAGGVLDPNTQADTFADHAFDKVNLYGMAVASYAIGGLPGQFSPAFNWSNKPKIDFDSPFGPLSSPAQVPLAVESLLGLATPDGLDVNRKDDSWFAIANVSQYLYLKEDPKAVAEKMRTGQVLNGLAMFGRIGYAPESTNPITQDYSIGLFAHGLIDGRNYDSFGAGFYYNKFSDGLKRSIATLTAGTATVEDEKGVEVFYDYALTPAVRLIPSYQHIWNPLTAEVAEHVDHADIFLSRMTVAW